MQLVALHSPLITWKWEDSILLGAALLVKETPPYCMLDDVGGATNIA